MTRAAAHVASLQEKLQRPNQHLADLQAKAAAKTKAREDKSASRAKAREARKAARAATKAATAATKQAKKRRK